MDTQTPLDGVSEETEETERKRRGLIWFFRRPLVLPWVIGLTALAILSASVLAFGVGPFKGIFGGGDQDSSVPYVEPRPAATSTATPRPSGAPTTPPPVVVTLPAPSTSAPGEPEASPTVTVEAPAVPATPERPGQPAPPEANETLSLGIRTDASMPLSAANMAPGDRVTSSVTLENTGSLALRYSMQSLLTGGTVDAARQVQLTVKSGVQSCTTAGFTGSGTVLYSGVFADAAAVPVLGSAAKGAQPGDRSIAPEGSEVLCLQVHLPGESTGNAFQGGAASASLQFDAEDPRG